MRILSAHTGSLGYKGEAHLRSFRNAGRAGRDLMDSLNRRWRPCLLLRGRCKTCQPALLKAGDPKLAYGQLRSQVSNHGMEPNHEKGHCTEGDLICGMPLVVITRMLMARTVQFT